MNGDQYGDDREGMMRVHVADDRSRLAGSLYTMAELRQWAKHNGVLIRVNNKRDFAWYMAQHGLIDADGYLRDGFPTGSAS